MTTSVTVAGGGMVGTACALRLQASGLQVTLADPGDDRRAASWGNIGHLAIEQVEPMPSFRTLRSFPRQLFAFGGALDFRVADVGLWLPWSLRFVLASRPATYRRGHEALRSLQVLAGDAWTRLSELAGDDSLVQRRGHAVLWMDQREAAAGLARWSRSDTGAATFAELTPDELASYRRVMKAAPVAGIRFSGTGQFRDPQGVRDALRAAFRARGGTVVAAGVRVLVPEGGGVRVTLDDGRSWSSSLALVCCGARSAALMQPLGAVAPLIGERGYSIHSATHDWPSDLPTTVFDARSVVLSRFDSGLRASSFLEFGDPDAPGDPRKWAVIADHLRALGIGFSDAPERWVGPRPTLPDYLPAIGRLQASPQILYAFGHQHLGMTLSAVTAEVVAAMAHDGAAPVDVTPFRIERFGTRKR